MRNAENKGGKGKNVKEEMRGKLRGRTKGMEESNILNILTSHVVTKGGGVSGRGEDGARAEKTCESEYGTKRGVAQDTNNDINVKPNLARVLTLLLLSQLHVLFFTYTQD